LGILLLALLETVQKEDLLSFTKGGNTKTTGENRAKNNIIASTLSPHHS